MNLATDPNSALLAHREPVREDPPPPRKADPADGRPGSLRWLLPWAVLPLAILAPLIPGFPPFWMTLLSQIGIAALVALGLVVLTGIAGLSSFGQAMFVGCGAYATAVLTTRYSLSPWIGLGAALLASGLTAALIGVVTLRLKGHYLAVATIAWNVSFFYLAGNLDILQRYDGISGIPPMTLIGIDLTDPARFYYLILGALAICVALTGSLLGSRMGRAMRALRGGDVAAESFGINSFRARMLAFVYAAVLAGLAGWLYAHFQRAVNPSPFGLNYSIDYLLMVVAGGAAHIGGALLGATLVTLLRDQLQTLLPALLGAEGNFEVIVFGSLLVLLLQLAPEGLWPHLAAPFRRWSAPPEQEAVIDGEPRALPVRKRPKPGTELLRAEALHKRFGGLTAVDGVGFALKAGEIVGLIGPNGAGKSTTFNLLTGIVPASGGHVAFLGREISHSGPRAIAISGLARSFQHVRLMPGMTVLDNVLLGTHARGHAGALRGMLGFDHREEAALRAEALRQIDRVGLADYAQRIARELPLGRQRLVEIARALCLDPVLLLLDEPAAGLRQREKAELADLLDNLRREGLGILLVEHDMDFVMRLTDHLVVMNFGAELAQGTPREIRRNPAVIEAYLGSPA